MKRPPVHVINPFRRAESTATGLFSKSILVGLLCCLSLFPVYADEEATGVVKERMDMMKNMGKTMKSMKAMAQKKAPFDAEKIAVYAENLREAGTRIAELFPENSIQGKSDALPAIWKDWDKFTSLAEKLQTEADMLQEVSLMDTEKEVMKQFSVVGKTCRSCHTDFRKKKEKK